MGAQAYVSVENEFGQLLCQHDGSVCCQNHAHFGVCICIAVSDHWQGWSTWRATFCAFVYFCDVFRIRQCSAEDGNWPTSTSWHVGSGFPLAKSALCWWSHWCPVGSSM